jgi:hypothetical protein
LAAGTTAVCMFPCLSLRRLESCDFDVSSFVSFRRRVELSPQKSLYKISIISIIKQTHHYFPALLRCGIGVFVNPTAALTRPAHASESSPSAPFCGHLEPRPDNILLDLIHSSPPQRVLSRIHPAQVSDTFFALSPFQLASP